MGIIAWIVLGGIAGWIASLIMKTDKQMGLLGNIVVGIVGGLLGGFILQMFGVEGVEGFNLWSLLVAILGAVILLWLWSLITGSKAKK